MNKVIINTELCVKCGICAQICPMGIIRCSDAEGVTFHKESDSLCIKCGHCGAACPHNAITVMDIPCERWPEISPAGVSPEMLEKLMKQRRSIRQYKKDTVEKKLLNKIIDTLRWAPTAKNTQDVHFTVLLNPARTHETAGRVIDVFRTDESMAGIIKAWDKGVDMIMRGAPHLIVAHSPKTAMTPATDCAIALTAADYLAAAYGLGSCWAGFFLHAAHKDASIQKSLVIPDDHIICAALMIGYPKYRYLHVPPREHAKVSWL